MKYSIERTLSPKMESFGASYASDIVGAGEYMNGEGRSHRRHHDERGEADLPAFVRPAGDFPARISMPIFAAVPRGTPIVAGLPKVASAGPYYVASFDQDEGAPPEAQSELSREPSSATTRDPLHVRERAEGRR